MFEQYNHLPQMARMLHETASKAVRKAAFDIEGGGKVNAAVDTGFMKASIYTVTHDESSYGQGTAGNAGALLPEVEHPASDLEAFVAVGASYGIYVELGTHKMPAQPYLTPAADAVRPALEAAMHKLEQAFARVR